MTEDGPLVSIVTPALDPGERLERCLASVREQTWRRIEHIVVDGGSSDGTLERLASAVGIRWVSEPDEGQSDAINKGWRMASGEIMGWLNADDELLPDAVASVVAAFETDVEIGFVYGDVLTLEGTDRYVRRGTKVGDERGWSARNLASQPGSFNARWALERVNYLDASFDYTMDLDLWIRMIDAGIKGTYIPRTLAVFEVHDGSKSGSVARSSFVAEEAVARLRSGRIPSGAVAVGRVAALRAFEAGSLSERSIDDEIEMLLRDPRFSTAGTEPARVRAGARAEWAVLAAKSGTGRTMKPLLQPITWRFPESRARLRDAFSRRLGRAGRAMKGV